MADSPNLEKKHCLQGNTIFACLFVCLYFQTTPAFHYGRNTPFLSLCVWACACVCVIGSKRLGWSSSPTKTVLRLQDGKASLERCRADLPDSGFRLLFQHRKPICATPAPPRSYINCHIRRSRTWAIYQMSHHSNTLSVSVCVQSELQWFEFAFTTLSASPSDVSRKVLFFSFSLCQCPLHARPNLATCYGWLIIFDGGLPSEWSSSSLDW